jgi:D-arabinose 1-dehydrogenase-like Zn-dependent alcohol dehydrogenase
MRAARFTRADRGFSIETIPVPAPAPHEVVVRVAACGICLSDVHLLDGSLKTPLEVVTPGHEAAGTIAACGSSVSGWSVGQRVVMAGGKACGTCRSCLDGGGETRCSRFQIMGFAYDGAWAEYIAVPWSSLCAIPDHLPFPQAAILADAVSTPFAGLSDRGALRAGESVGLWALAGSACTPCRSRACSARRRSWRLTRCRTPAKGRWPPEPTWRSIPNMTTCGHGCSRSRAAAASISRVDLFGANQVLAEGVGCLARHGRMVMIGLSHDPIQLGPGVVFGVQSHALLGHLGYTKPQLDRLVELVSYGRLDVSRSISDLMPLADVARGVERLARKEGNPIRLVVEP